ncbi:DUF302 domain-containing protein [Rhodovulum sp. DZ06]|uniref:DUF302 domain-containing protein n=1 Tax=Rhodovulum sp. DZ06 TaxID=3425126 RepID=UPI003D33B411
MRRLILAAALLLPLSAQAQPAGWRSHDSAKGYAALLADLKAAVRAEGMGLVTEAGPTGAAAARGITIPGNRVVGVFRNDFAVRALAASEAAMIEAPIRFYVTERAQGARLSWKAPSAVFAPYDGGAELDAVGRELDALFDAIARRALAE